jgi:Ser/Thr protein kinase RdoA (MazF antagonist)
MQPQLISSACQLYATSPDQLIPLSGGYSNAVYKFPLPHTLQVSSQTLQVSKTWEIVKHGVLRIGVEDCPPEQTLGMLEWVRFLSDQGAPVTAPLPSINSCLLEHLDHEGKHYVITAFEEAEGTLAERIPPDEWTDDLFQRIGKAAGKFHRLSHGYHPSNPLLTRPMWFDSYEIHAAIRLLASSSDPALEKLTTLVSELKLLPVEPADFGLIHDDLHFANFLIRPDGQAIIIDFDDCCYGWFAIDVAMALFDILVLYNPSTEVEKQAFARRFLSNYLTGYRQEHSLSLYWQRQIPHFLKLKELCIYATLIGHADIALSDSWGGRFMRGRAERIANDIPYVIIDFENA